MSTNNLASILGLIADLMSIFGIGGFFSWAFVRKNVEGASVADIGVTAFSLAVKLLLSIFLIGVLLIPAYFFLMFFVALTSGSYATGDGLWNVNKVQHYTLAYFLIALWYIPLSILCVSSLFAWSMDPFVRFYRTFTRRNR